VSGRNRNRGQIPVSARQGRTPAGVSFTADQVGALLQMSNGGRADPLPRPPQWSTVPFAPGDPLIPAPINPVNPVTRRAEPRLRETEVSWNLNISTAPYVPWRILQEAADMPLFRKCIERRKSVCELDFTVAVDPKAIAREAALTGQHEKDIESALREQYTTEIARISDWLELPDRGNGYDWPAWTSQLMENRLKYDATVIYPRKTYGGDLFALEVIDGKTIKPLMDDRGGRPLPPAPFAQQILYGFPRGEYIADAEIGPDGKPWIPGGYTPDELVYERTIIRPETPYGMSATEIALLDGIVWMRRMGWIMAEYTEGVMPPAMIETAETLEWNEVQWQDWQRALNDHLGGNTQERMKFPLMPPGTKAVQFPDQAERYKPDYDLFLVKLIAGDFGLPASEVGFTEAGALGASFHEGEEDILNRQTRRPDANWLSRVATKLAVRQLGMPNVLQVQILGLESEDEAAADAVASDRISRGVMSRNEDRGRIGLPPLQFEEADMMTVDVGRGVVFLDGASKLGAPGTLIQPPQAPPQMAPPAQDIGMGGADPKHGGQDDDEDGPQVSKAAEARALRRWLAKGAQARSQGRRRTPFECQALTEADARRMGLPASGEVVFKADDAGPKAHAGRGLAGTGTGTS
jgi:hypothetical protein